MKVEIAYTDGRNYEEREAGTLAEAEAIIAKLASKYFSKGFELRTVDLGIAGDGVTHEYAVALKYPIADDDWREIAYIAVDEADEAASLI